MIITRASDNIMIDYNKSFLHLAGFKYKELQNKKAMDLNLWPVEERNEVINIIKEKGSIHNFEGHFKSKSGETYTGLLSAETLDISGERCILFVTNDITERKQIEHRLLKSEAKYRELAESISDIFIALDSELRYVYWNKKAQDKMSEEFVGKHLTEVFPELKGSLTKLKYHAALATGQPQFFEDIRNYDKSQQVYNLSVYPSKEGLSVLIKDITEEKQLEKEMARLGRLNLVGQMAGGIAHEIRNPMTSVRGYLQFLGQKKEFEKYIDRFQLMIN